MQPADVASHVRAAGHDCAYVVLYVSMAALPVIAAAAERGHIVEVSILLLDLLEFVAVIQTLLVACPEGQPIFMAAVAVGPFE